MADKVELRWTPLRSLLEKEIRRFLRVLGQTLLVPLVNATLYLLIFGVSLGDRIAVSPELPYLAFLIPGLVMMGVLHNAFQNSSSSIATSKFHGDLEDLRMVPVAPWQIVTAMGLGGVVRGGLVGFVTFAVGEAFFLATRETWLTIAHPLLLIFFLVAGGLSFSFLGMVVAFRAKSIDELTAIGGFILLPLLYLGGVFFPLTHLHPFWQGLSHANPMLYFINGVRFAILGRSDVAWTVCAAVAAGTFVAMYGLALRAVRRGPFTRW